MTEPVLDGLATLRPTAPADLVPAVLRRAGLADAWLAADSPVGPVLVAYGARGIVAVEPAFERGAAAAFERGFRERFGRPVAPDPHPDPALRAAVQRGLVEGRGRGLRFDLRMTSPFGRAVLAAALRIPRGEVRPYAWVAREIGHPAAVRAVGSALARNPVPLLIPCHRVVRSDGLIGAYGWGSDMKRAVLTAEGLDPAGLEQAARSGRRYVGSRATHIVCLPTCRRARRIAPAHQVPFGDLATAREAGYRPCRVCRP